MVNGVTSQILHFPLGAADHGAELGVVICDAEGQM
jgi:hypothetical protein